MAQPITIAIVDDNPMLLEQIKENVSSFDEVEVLFTAIHGEDLLQQLERCDRLPQVILMDIEMPVMNGLEATAVIAAETDIRVLILTVFDNDDKIFDAIKAGAAGYLLKDSKPARIIHAIEDVMEGGAPLSPHIAGKALAFLRKAVDDEQVQKRAPKDYDLSTRETELLELLVKGNSYQQIADRLFISHGTVRKHIQNVYSKLHIHSKVEAVNKANHHKWFR